MAQTEPYATIDKVIRRALLGDGDERLTRYGRALVQARRLYETEYVGTAEASYGHRTARLEVQPDRTVELPDDYVEYHMLGLLTEGSQQVRNLLHNPLLVQAPVRLGVHIEPSVYRYAYTGSELLSQTGADVWGYGYPSARAGEFTIQRAERQILVSSAIAPGAVLYLHYISNDAPMGEATPIHPLAVGWFEFYILGHLYRKTNPGLSAVYLRDAENARREYLLQRANLSLDTVFAAMRNTLARV